MIEHRDLGGGVAELVLNRAPVNALDPGFLNGFADRLAVLATDDAVRAVVLTSALRVFSAGLDLKAALDLDRAGQREIFDALNHGFLAQFTFPKPIVAAVNGAAIAGGLFFVLAADWRVAGPRASFGLAEVRVGADLPVAPMEIARATLDPGTLRRLLLTGQPIAAADAAGQGLVDDLVEAEAVPDTALAKARELADLPAATYARIKAQLHAPAVAAIRAGMDQLAIDPDRGWFSAETRDAMQRMLG